MLLLKRNDLLYDEIRYITDGYGKLSIIFDYRTYGEFLGAHKTDGEEVELNTLNNPVRFLYNGEYGVMTDDNGLLYMRQRYYNTEKKRFINQDILRGKITDSQSLNRYSYVEGDPINYMDPFGLSKLRNTLDSLTNNLDAINEFLSHPIRNTGKFLAMCGPVSRFSTK